MGTTTKAAHVLFFRDENLSFHGYVLAFLEAILLSRAARAKLMKKSALSNPVADAGQFVQRIRLMSEDPNTSPKWYNGFSNLKRGDDVIAIYWVCKTPSHIISSPLAHSTVIVLENQDGWQIRVEARDPKTAQQRINAAKNESALSVSHRIAKELKG